MIPLRPGIGGTLLVRVQGDVSSALRHVEAQVEKLVPNTPFHYTFLDDFFHQPYRAEERLGQVFGLFAGMSVLIACLGLFGPAAYTAERRWKEIGIRKVLGATVAHIAALLSHEFTPLVLLAFLLGASITYVAMDHWLENFVYRIDISWSMLTPTFIYPPRPHDLFHDPGHIRPGHLSCCAWCEFP